MKQVRQVRQVRQVKQASHTPITLKIYAGSRYPQVQNGYDSYCHAYRPDYVQPDAWRLHLKAVLPANIVHCHWQVTAEEGEFTTDSEQEKEQLALGELAVWVPAPGKYQITLTVVEENGRSHTKKQTFHLRDYLIVAIGDSYFCGEGNPDEPAEPSTIVGNIACNLATFTKFLIKKADIEVPLEQEAVWQEKFVHRSYNSGISRAVRALEKPEEGIVVTYLNFARSGAAINKGFFGPRDQDEWTDIGELEEARQTSNGRPIDALFLSTGGNDIEFSDRLIDLLRDDLPIVGEGGLLDDDDLNRQKELDEAKKLMAALPAKLDKLAAGVAEFNPRQIFLTEYPIAHYDVVNEEGKITTNSGCGIFDSPGMGIDERDAELIKKMGKKLNQTLQEAADRHGWIYVDGIADGFAGHGRCSDDSYFYSAEESCKMQGDFKGTMHPNLKGITVYADCIEAAFKEHGLWDVG